MKPLVVGLTGGIASGKTAASDYFAELGVQVIDTDLLAREVVQPGEPALAKIAEHFGQAVMQKNGCLDRKALGQIIFNNPTEKQWLENLLHPLIRERAAQAIKHCNAPYCILVVPLLIENYPYPLADRVLVVECSPEQQLHYTMQRDSLTEEQAKKIIRSQASNEQRRKHADDLLMNTSNLETLKLRVAELHQQYLLNARSSN